MCWRSKVGVNSGSYDCLLHCGLQLLLLSAAVSTAQAPASAPVPVGSFFDLPLSPGELAVCHCSDCWRTPK